LATLLRQSEPAAAVRRRTLSILKCAVELHPHIPVNRSELSHWKFDFPPPCRTPSRPAGDDIPRDVAGYLAIARSMTFTTPEPITGAFDRQGFRTPSRASAPAGQGLAELPCDPRRPGLGAGSLDAAPTADPQS